MVSKFSKFSQGWKDRLKLWDTYVLLRFFQHYYTILYFFPPSTCMGCKLVGEELLNVHIVKLKLLHTESRAINTKDAISVVQVNN